MDPSTVIVADSSNPSSLRALAEQTAVLCTTVGPYGQHGAPVVEACVDAGASYCDLSGEVPFIRRMIDAHHEAAQVKGLRIVHCCGFDSIPSDLGVLFLQEACEREFGSPADEVRLYVAGSRGGFSGGTLASFLHVLNEAKDPSVQRILRDPYALNPPSASSGPDGNDMLPPQWDEVMQAWIGPFVMAAINARVVRRTNALTGFRYGRDFRYSEVMKLGPGWKGRASAYALSGGLGAFLGGAMWSPTRRLLQTFVLPKPGQGPSEESIRSGFFKMILSARRDGSEVLRAIVKGKGDPGYGATSCMIAESAVCLARDDLNGVCGVTTPAAAMGTRLRERLAAQDLSFELERV